MRNETRLHPGARWQLSMISLVTVLVLSSGMGPMAFAAPAATCTGQMSARYVAGPAFGRDGDYYRVELGFGTGSITGGGTNTLSLSTVRFHLDCMYQGFPGCVDDGNVINFIGNLTTSCGTGQPGFWTVSQGANTVDFTAQSPVVIPAMIPAFPGFCQLQFTVRIASIAAARDDGPLSTNQVEEMASYLVALCDNGLPANIFATSVIAICPECS